MCSTTIIVIHTLSECNDLQKLLFHGQEYLRAAAPSGPLSYCFGITLLLERNLLPFGNQVDGSPLVAIPKQ